MSAVHLIIRSGLAALLVLGASLSEAQHIYVCRDASGRTISSDIPMPECADRAVQELNKTGNVVREIPAPLTPEQANQKALEERQRKEADEALREQQRKDRALLAAYSSEHDLEIARQRALADAQELIRGSNERLTVLNQERKQILTEKELYKNKTVPVILQRRIDANDAEIAAAQHTIADRNAEIERINQHFNSDLQRYRYLNGKNPK